MNRQPLIVRTAATLAMAALGCGSALAQTSGDRIRELMDQAKLALQQQPQPPTAIHAPSGGPTVALTIDDAVALALERNLDIAVQRIDPQLQDIAIASAEAFYNPTLTSTLNRTHQVGTPSSQLQLASGGVGITRDSYQYNGGFSQNLRWYGSSFTATLNNNRDESNSNNSLFNPSYASTWTFNYRQPLLRGFRVDSQRRQLQVTRVSRDISEVQLRALTTNVVSNVRNAYWDYVFATESVEVARESLALATKLVQDNEARVEIGTMAPIDVVQAQAEQATRQQNVVTAENAKRTTELALKRLIVGGTDDPNWSAALEAIDRPGFAPEPIDLEGAITRALSERTDVSIAAKNIENNALTVRFLQDQALPGLDLDVSYGFQGIGGTQLQRAQDGVLGSTVTTVTPGGISDAFSSLLSRDFPRWTVALNLSYPLGTSTQDAAVARSRLQLSQVEAQIKQIELQIATEVTSAAIQLRNMAESVQAAQAARELSERRLEAEQSKFEVGISTNYFVVQAQRDLNDARNSELRSVLDYRKALVEFERLQQTTLQNSNVTVVQPGG